LRRRFRSCPRNCKRRAKDHECHWGQYPWEGGPKAVTREPGNLLPVMCHARTRWAGCSRALNKSVCVCPLGEGCATTSRGDGWARSPSSGKCSSALSVVLHATARSQFRMDRIRLHGASASALWRCLPCFVASLRPAAKRERMSIKNPRSFLKRSFRQIGAQSRSKVASRR
jgi:hypothetical protein